LTQLGKFTFKTDVEYFTCVMNKYFRKEPPVPTNIYLQPSELLTIENKKKVATLCHFPSIINTLAKDENYEVREAAEKNDFWILVGQLQDVLGFGKRERKEFAQQEVFRILMVLLLFEDDITILIEVLRNASISTKMIMHYIKLLGERGRGKKDNQLLEEAERILIEKKQSIIKASDIKKASKDLDEKKSKKIILSRLSDEYKMIRKAVTNILTDIDPYILHEFIILAIDDPPEERLLNQFIILTELSHLVKKREDIKNASLEYLTSVIADESISRNLSISQYFTQIINRRRKELLDTCQKDLTDFQHILLITYCHCDTDHEIKNIVQRIISLDDIFALVQDISTPQHHFKRILNILAEHPNEDVRKRVTDTFHEESRRLWNRLKELEQSQQAYFDLVFQSLGFNQINKYQVAIKTIMHAEHTISTFLSAFNDKLQDEIKTAKPTLTNVKGFLQQNIDLINADISPNMMQEIEQIHSMILQIIGLQHFGLEGLRPGLIEDIDPVLLSKARTIWQSALGQFLGRIKHLHEMIRIKFMKVAAKEIPLGELEKEYQAVCDTLEKEHKSKIECTLTIRCEDCSRRGCASERFLMESEFFINELVDNFIENP
jgi:hypothetical protein